jgi:hypothetical protein
MLSVMCWSAERSIGRRPALSMIPAIPHIVVSVSLRRGRLA